MKPGTSRVGRLDILHALRGVAALLVLYAHLFAVGVNDSFTPSAYVPAISGTPLVEAERAAAAPYLVPEYWLGAWGVNSGHLGVMVFFLISGFVIVLSSRRTDPFTFLTRRALRIYPTCFVAVGLTALGGAAYCAVYGANYPFGVSATVHSALLTSGWVGSAAVIPVLWTLAAEVAFYLVLSSVALITGGAVGLRGLLAAGLLCLVVIAMGGLADQANAVLPMLGPVLRWSAFLAVYVNFMLVGSALSLAIFREGRRSGRFVAVLVVVGIYVLGVLLHRQSSGGAHSTITSDLMIAALFAGVIYAGQWFRAPAVLNFFGDISYPLYLIHVPLSWVVLYEVTRRGGNVHWAVVASVSIVVAVAWLLHRLVERPSQVWSQGFDVERTLWLRERLRGGRVTAIAASPVQQSEPL